MGAGLVRPQQPIGAPSRVLSQSSGKAGDPAWEAQKAAQSRSNAQMTYNSFSPDNQASHEVREVSPGFWGAVPKAGSGGGDAAGGGGGGFSYGGADGGPGGGDMGGGAGPADMKPTSGMGSDSMRSLMQAMNPQQQTPMLGGDMGDDNSQSLGKGTPRNRSGALAALAGIIY